VKGAQLAFIALLVLRSQYHVRQGSLARLDQQQWLLAQVGSIAIRTLDSKRLNVQSTHIVLADQQIQSLVIKSIHAHPGLRRKFSVRTDIMLIQGHHPMAVSIFARCAELEHIQSQIHKDAFHAQKDIYATEALIQTSLIALHITTARSVPKVNTVPKDHTIASHAHPAPTISNSVQARSKNALSAQSARPTQTTALRDARLVASSLQVSRVLKCALA
jgi:hypothetical protein